MHFAHAPKLFIVLASMALAACARPNIEIDMRELEASPLGYKPVGLLEVRMANTGNAYGMRLGESLSESAFCTATLIDAQTLLTSADCLQNKLGRFDTKDMTFYLRKPGDSHTVSFPIKGIQSADLSKGYVLFSVATAVDAVALSGGNLSLQNEAPDGEALSENINAFVVSAPAPNKEGRCTLRVSESTLLTASAVGKVNPVLEDTEEEEDATSNRGSGPPLDENVPVRENTPRSEITTPANPSVPHVPAVTREELLKRVYSSPREIQVTALKDGTWGAPIFHNGKIVGVIKDQGSSRSGFNGFWIVK